MLPAAFPHFGPKQSGPVGPSFAAGMDQTSCWRLPHPHYAMQDLGGVYLSLVPEG